MLGWILLKHRPHSQFIQIGQKTETFFQEEHVS